MPVNVTSDTRSFRPTLPRGERRLGRRAHRQSGRGFDPRSRAESDSSIRPCQPGPARRATSNVPGTPASSGSFDPRSRAESDGSLAAVAARLTGFDPRSRAESDHHGADEPHSGAEFRPTLPRGERPVHQEGPSVGFEVSTHAPARRATRSPCNRDAGNRRFDPRSRAESDLPLGMRLSITRGFDPRSRAESDYFSTAA